MVNHQPAQKDKRKVSFYWVLGGNWRGSLRTKVYWKRIRDRDCGFSLSASGSAMLLGQRGIFFPSLKSRRQNSYVKNGLCWSDSYLPSSPGDTGC